MSLSPNPQAAQQYLRTKVLTATPEQLQLMLFDGAIRFGDQARAALTRKKFDESCSLICKMQKILCELTGSLKRGVAPDLCDKLSALYTYAYKLLIKANMEHDLAAIDEAMKVLRYQRETWVMLLEQISRQKASAAINKIDLPEPSARMEASLSMRG